MTDDDFHHDCGLLTPPAGTLERITGDTLAGTHNVSLGAGIPKLIALPT
jgi:hypothetical protein